MFEEENNRNFIFYFVATADGAAADLRLGFGVVPSRKPFLNLLNTFFKCLIRPVPVVLLLFAFTLQL